MFITTVEDKFEPIKEKYGFEKGRVRPEKLFHSVDYYNSNVNINFYFETMEYRVFVSLAKIHDEDNELMENMSSYGIEYMLKVRAPDILSTFLNELESDNDVVNMIGFCVGALETYASDLLRGEDKLFDEMKVEWIRDYK